LNGKIPILEEKHKWPGPYCLRDSKLTHLIWGSPSGGFVNFLGRKSNCTWLQYMDDLLLASHDWEKCWEGTKTLLAWHFKAGYKVPGKKPKFASKRSNTLDCHLRMTMHLGSERKQIICSIPQTKTKREVREFLGVAGFCCIWIPGYSSLAKPLYKATAGSGKDPLNWGPDREKVFQEIKRLITSTPALGLPDVT
jgi:hypothetical protein